MQQKKLEIRPEALKSFKKKLEDILINDIKISNLPEVVPINPDDEISSSEYIDPSPSSFEDSKDTPVNHIPYIVSDDFYNKLLNVGNTFDRETEQQLENILGQGNLSYLLLEIINNYLNNQYKIIEKQLSQLKPQILPNHDAPQAELKRLVNLAIPKIVEESEEIKAKRKELHSQISFIPCAEILINVLIDLPQEYNVNIGLSSQNVDFNDILIEGEINISLINNTSTTLPEQNQSFNFNNFSKGIDFFLTRSVDSYNDSHNVVLKIILDGYIINDKYDAPIYSKIVRTIKALIGIGLSRRMFYIKYVNLNDANTSIMHKKLLSSFIFHKKLQVNNTYDESMSYLYPLHPDESRLITLLDINNDLTSNDIKNILELIAKILNSDEKDSNAQKIKIAAEWYFDSLANTNNQILAYIQATTAIESLLGENEADNYKGLGLTKLLSNRCAYLIANNTSERDELNKSFNMIYDMRSRILHSGTTQTKGNYGFDDCFNKLHDILRRVLAKEIELYSQNK